MAEKKGVGHAYNVDFLNVVFAASSIFLFLSVIWMVWDDYDREWKNTQRQFGELEIQVTQASLEQAGRDVDPTKLTALQGSLAEAQKSVEANQAKIDELRDQMTEVDARLARESQDYQFSKATYDQDRYDYEAARVAERVRRGAQGRGGDGAARSHQRAPAPDGEDDRGAQRASAAARPADRRGRQVPGRDHRDSAGAEPAPHAPRRPRAEHAEGLLPRRAAARLHGADAQGPAGHPAQRRRRRELREGGEDGSLPDLPSRHRSRGLREVSAAVPDASQPGRLSRQQLEAPARSGRLHRLPRRHGSVGELQATPGTCRARQVRGAPQRHDLEEASTSGKRSTTGKSRTAGTTRCCRPT